MFRSPGVRSEPRQGRGLVGNLADLLVDPVSIVGLKCMQKTSPAEAGQQIVRSTIRRRCH